MSLYRLSGGRLGASFRGAPVLLLTTTGRKTGLPRTTPVLYLRDGSRIVTVASNGGRDADPSWWKNLKAKPEASLQIKRTMMRVQARMASPDEKERFWPLLTKMYPGYAGYQKKTKRTIPVVIMEESR